MQGSDAALRRTEGERDEARAEAVRLRAEVVALRARIAELDPGGGDSGAPIGGLVPTARGASGFARPVRELDLQTTVIEEEDGSEDEDADGGEGEGEAWSGPEPELGSASEPEPEPEPEAVVPSPKSSPRAGGTPKARRKKFASPQPQFEVEQPKSKSLFSNKKGRNKVSKVRLACRHPMQQSDSPDGGSQLSSSCARPEPSLRGWPRDDGQGQRAGVGTPVRRRHSLVNGNLLENMDGASAIAAVVVRTSLPGARAAHSHGLSRGAGVVH